MKVRRLTLSVGLVLITSTLATAAVPSSSSRRTRELYARQCALCHGVDGAASGPAAFLLFPPARDFTRGQFELASTANGVPTDADLVATLRRGVPGSAMPSWSWMEEDTLEDLAEHVRELAVDGLADDLWRAEGLSAEEARARAQERLTPGEPVELGEPAEPTASVLERGASLYRTYCAECHAEDGKGHPELVRRDADQTLSWARDFTAGILKGGTSHEELAKRIEVGLHGTAMPSSRLSLEARSALIAYVRSLIPEDAEDRLVQERRVVPARRITYGSIAAGEPIDWDLAEEVELVLAPLWWREEAILRARVTAVHDRESLAVRVRWDDPTLDAPVDLEFPLASAQYADAVALQLSPERHPPFFGMGPAGSMTNLWHWRAVDVPKGEDVQAALRRFPHRVGDWLLDDALGGRPLYQLVPGPVEVEGEARAAVPAGMQRLELQRPLPDDAVRASARWADGAWEVVFVRRLEPEPGTGALPLAMGGRVSIDLAVWNGAIRDLRGQKSVTLWHELRLET